MRASRSAKAFSASPQRSLVPPLLAAIALCTGLAGYVTAWSARSSYAGVQIGMAFALGVMDRLGPTVNLMPPVNRILGIIVGNLVTAAVFSWVWPVFAGEQMTRSLVGAGAAASLGALTIGTA